MFKHCAVGTPETPLEADDLGVGLSLVGVLPLDEGVPDDLDDGVEYKVHTDGQVDCGD